MIQKSCKRILLSCVKEFYHLLLFFIYVEHTTEEHNMAVFGIVKIAEAVANPSFCAVCQAGEKFQLNVSSAAVVDLKRLFSVKGL